MDDCEIRALETIDTFLPVVDGAINAVKFYAHSLNKKIVCKVAVPSADKKERYKDREDFEVYRCASSSAPENYRLAHPETDAKFQKKIKAEGFNIYHAHSPFAMGHWALKCAKKEGVPLIATLHTKYFDDFMRVTKSDTLSKIALSYAMQVYNEADSVWTVSHEAVKVLRDYGYKKPVVVIQNGTDFTYPKNGDELVAKVNKLHSLEGQKNVFLFVGRIASYKGVFIIAEAMAELKKLGKDFKMIFVGGGFDLEFLKNYVESVGIDDVCVFTGIVKDRELLQGYYLRSDVFVFPSTFDTSGMVKIEAAAHKIPSVLIKNSACAEGVEDGVNGFLCEENASSLKDKLLEIIDLGGDKKTEIGENAYKTLYRSWDTVAEEVIEKYKEVIEKYNKRQEALGRVKSINAARTAVKKRKHFWKRLDDIVKKQLEGFRKKNKNDK